MNKIFSVITVALVSSVFCCNILAENSLENFSKYISGIFAKNSYCPKNIEVTNKGSDSAFSYSLKSNSSVFIHGDISGQIHKNKTENFVFTHAVSIERNRIYSECFYSYAFHSSRKKIIYRNMPLTKKMFEKYFPGYEPVVLPKVTMHSNIPLKANTSSIENNWVKYSNGVFVCRVNPAHCPFMKY